MKLTGKLHISDVEKLSNALKEILDSEQNIKLDITEVTDADTASLQVLCALQKSLSFTGNRIGWIGESEALNNIASQLGVEDYLDLPGL